MFSGFSHRPVTVCLGGNKDKTLVVKRTRLLVYGWVGLVVRPSLALQQEEKLLTVEL